MANPQVIDGALPMSPPRKNEKITRESFSKFIDGLSVGDDLKKKLKEITPFTYTGY